LGRPVTSLSGGQRRFLEEDQTRPVRPSPAKRSGDPVRHFSHRRIGQGPAITTEVGTGDTGKALKQKGFPSGQAALWKTPGG
jgi:hypothetical protein